MRFFRLLVPAVVLSLLVLSGLGMRQAAAQFSDSWEFLKAVKEDDRKEIRDRYRKGANMNAKNSDGLPAMIIAAERGK